MKRALIFCLASCAVIQLRAALPASGGTAPQYTTAQSKWNFYLGISKTYAPEAYTILSGLNDWQKYVQYAGDADTELELIEQYNTVVHEACHGYQWEMTTGTWNSEGYFMNAEETWTFPKTPIFNSNELNRYVPDSAQRRVFRYETYIGEKSNLSSQVNGIYGIMDEFTSYYQGTLAVYRLKPWFEKKYGSHDPEPWVKVYMAQFGSTIYAYHEFRLFMGWYLEYARKYHPDVYQGLMGNMGLRSAFAAFMNAYYELVQTYLNEVEEIVTRFANCATPVTATDQYVYIRKGNMRYGTGHRLDEIIWLASVETDAMWDGLANFGGGEAEE